MRSKSAARKFKSVDDANRVVKLINDQYGDQGEFMIKPFESISKKTVL